MNQSHHIEPHLLGYPHQTLHHPLPLWSLAAEGFWQTLGWLQSVFQEQSWLFYLLDTHRRGQTHPSLLSKVCMPNRHS